MVERFSNPSASLATVRPAVVKSSSIKPTEYDDLVRSRQGNRRSIRVQRFRPFVVRQVGTVRVPRNDGLLRSRAGIDPTAFARSTFGRRPPRASSRRKLSKFANPLFIGDKLVEVKPPLERSEVHRRHGHRQQAQTRNPGEPHARAGFGRRASQRNLEEKATAVEVTGRPTLDDLNGPSDGHGRRRRQGVGIPQS